MSALYAVEQEHCLEFHVIQNAPIGFKDKQDVHHGE